MKDDLIGRLRFGIGYHATSKDIADACGLMDTAADEIERLRARVAAVEAERDAARDKALEEAAAVWPLVSETFAYQAEGYAGGWSAAVRAMKATIRTLKDQPHG